MRFFPHEVKDLEPTWTFLKQGSGQEIRKRKWEVDYILLLWLSVILYIPFSLTTVVLSSTIEDLLETGKSILASPAKTRDAAAEMLSRLLTRPDMEAAPLDAFLHWADNSLLTSDTFLVRYRTFTAQTCHVTANTYTPLFSRFLLWLEDRHIKHIGQHLQEGPTRGIEGEGIHHIRQVHLYDIRESCAEVAMHEVDTTPWTRSPETQTT